MQVRWAFDTQNALDGNYRKYLGPGNKEVGNWTHPWRAVDPRQLGNSRLHVYLIRQLYFFIKGAHFIAISFSEAGWDRLVLCRFMRVL